MHESKIFKAKFNLRHNLNLRKIVLKVAPRVNILQILPKLDYIADIEF